MGQKIKKLFTITFSFVPENQTISSSKIAIAIKPYLTFSLTESLVEKTADSSDPEPARMARQARKAVQDPHLKLAAVT